MFDFWMAALIGGCLGTWLFLKLNRSSGMVNSGKNAIAGSIVGFIAFIILFTLFKYTLHLS